MNLLPPRLYTAMNAALFIAYNGRKERPVSGTSIVEFCGLKERALEPVLQKLSNAGIIVSVKGARGGYYVADLDNVTLRDIVECFVSSPVPKDSEFGGFSQILEDRLVSSYSEWLEVLEETSLRHLCNRALVSQVPTYDAPPLDFVV